jgi:cell division ATPase FtsA
MVDEDETMEVASVGGRKSRVMARRILSEILQPRAEEIFHLLWDEIRRAGFEKSLNSGIVLTGGGSMLKNLDKRLREETGLPLAMAEDPLSSVVLGAGKMLSDFNLLRKISID